MREKIARVTIAVACAVSTFIAGCGKKEAPAPPPPAKPESSSVSSLLENQGAAPNSPPPPAAPAPPPAAAVSSTQPAPMPEAPAVEEPLTGPYALERQFMTQQLGVFIAQNKRMPKDFNELAATRLDSVPQAPAGQKWAIDQINRKIIAVRK